MVVTMIGVSVAPVHLSPIDLLLCSTFGIALASVDGFHLLMVQLDVLSKVQVPSAHE